MENKAFSVSHKQGFIQSYSELVLLSMWQSQLLLNDIHTYILRKT